MIIKIQRSIVTNMPVPQVVIYNEDRSIFWQGPMPEDIKKLMGRYSKVYAKAKIVGTEVVVDRIIADQDW